MTYTKSSINETISLLLVLLLSYMNEETKTCLSVCVLVCGHARYRSSWSACVLMHVEAIV